MLESLILVARQVGVLFALMAVGFACNRAKLLDRGAVKGMVNVLMLIVTPCLIIHVFQRPFQPHLLANLGWAFALCITVQVMGAIVSTLLVRGRVPLSQRSVLRAAVTFSNAGFMGIPLEYALLGADGVFFGIVYVVVFNLLFWSWGLVTMAGSLKDVRMRTLFVNPGSVGIVLGLPFFLLSVKLPPLVGESVKMMADLNTPLAMIVIGFYLADARFGAVLRNAWAYGAAVLRLVVLPLAALGVIWGVSRLVGTIEPKMAAALSTAAAAPVAALVSMFAVRYDRDVALSVGLVSATTLLSILTMPPIVGLALWLFGCS